MTSCGRTHSSSHPKALICRFRLGQRGAFAGEDEGCELRGRIMASSPPWRCGQPEAVTSTWKRGAPMTTSPGSKPFLRPWSVNPGGHGGADTVSEHPGTVGFRARASRPRPPNPCGARRARVQVAGCGQLWLSGTLLR